MGPGRVPAPSWVSVSRSEQWGGRVDIAVGPRSTGTALLSISPTWKDHEHGKETDRRSGNGREYWMGDRIRPQSPPPHNGAWAFSQSPAGAGRREGSGPAGIWRWSLAGPPAVFGLEVWPGSCGYGEVGLLCPGICVRFAHPATTAHPGNSEPRALPGRLTQVSFPLCGRAREVEQGPAWGWAALTVVGTGMDCRNRTNPFGTQMGRLRPRNGAWLSQRRHSWADTELVSPQCDGAGTGGAGARARASFCVTWMRLFVPLLLKEMTDWIGSLPAFQKLPLLSEKVRKESC